MRVPRTSAFFHDPAAALVTDGPPVAALPGRLSDDAGVPR